MSEEEKKAIEELKKVRWGSLAIVVKNEDGKMDISYFTEKHKKTILNLIEKLQKENEELENEKKETMDYEKEYKKMKIRYNKLLEELVNENYEKEYKKMQSRYNKLLDENKKLNKALVNLALKVK